MSKYSQGVFVPKNPEKYIGRGNIIFRSSWEKVFMTFCDNHPNVLQWSSESLRIPYVNPLTGKNTSYVPDFLIVYQDATGQTHVEIIEIKPSSQASIHEAKSQHDKLSFVINAAKWQAATIFCKAKGMKFRVVTQHDIFAGTKR